MPQYKSVPMKVAATAVDSSALTEGQFIALASVFGNVDSYGEVVMPGAFTDDLTAWKESGEVIPVYWGHRMDDPSMCVGAVIDAAETADGLQVKAQLDLDTPSGQQVYRLLKGRRVARMSFAYDVLDGGYGERDGEQVYELRKLKIHEVSVVQVPANPAAVVQDVKSGAEPDGTKDASKTGRVLSAKNEETLRSAIEKVTAGIADVKSVLAALDTSKDGHNSSQPDVSEEPDGAKEDGTAPGPASLRLLNELDALAVELTAS